MGRSWKADDIAIQAPHYRHLFAARHATACLGTRGHHPSARLRTPRRVRAHPPTRLMVDNAIDRALATGGQTSVTPVMVLVMWEDGTGALAASARRRLHRLVRASTASSGGRWRP